MTAALLVALFFLIHAWLDDLFVRQQRERWNTLNQVVHAHRTNDLYAE